MKQLFNELSIDDKIFVCWSGGLDSTYFIWKALSMGFNITAAYFELSNNKEKTKREKKAIENILPYFKDSPNFKYVGVSFLVDIVEANCISSFSQFPLWLTGSMFCSGDCNKVVISYVMGDDAISYLNDFKKIYESYSLLFTTESELIFPLSKVNKETILGDLPINIMDKITFCESEDKEEDNCGKCIPCLKWKMLEEKNQFFKVSHYRFKNKNEDENEDMMVELSQIEEIKQ